jgi:hypothetical protein
VYRNKKGTLRVKRSKQIEISFFCPQKTTEHSFGMLGRYFHKNLDITSWALRPVSPVLPVLPCPELLELLPVLVPVLVPVPVPLLGPQASWAPLASCMRLLRRTPLREISHKLMPKPSSLRFHLLYKMCPEIVGKAKVNLASCQENFFQFSQ